MQRSLSMDTTLRHALKHEDGSLYRTKLVIKEEDMSDRDALLNQENT